jgi:hypothetical protein
MNKQNDYMNQEPGKKSFTSFLEKDGERKMNTWKPEPDLEKNKFTPKEIVINIGIALGAILGTIIMIAALVGTVYIIISALKAFIRILLS